MTDKETFAQARLAIRDTGNAQAWFDLGMLYSRGIGTRENHVLATYYIKKAEALGYEAAARELERESGILMGDIVEYVKRMLEETPSPDEETRRRVHDRLEEERELGNEGVFRQLHAELPLFYGQMDRETGRADILAGSKTAYADIEYALCTPHNETEVDLPVLENFLRQLHLPIRRKDYLWELDFGCPQPCLDEEHQLTGECLSNLRSTYETLCTEHGIRPLPLDTIPSADCFPYVSPGKMRRLRHQAYRCLLSLREVDESVIDRFLDNLDSDNALLDICEKVEEYSSLQMFLISYVEMNIVIETLVLSYQRLLDAFQKGSHSWTCLVDRLNACRRAILRPGIEAELPEYTVRDIPTIDLAKSDDEDYDWDLGSGLDFGTLGPF